VTHLRTIIFQENFIGWADGIKQGAFYFGLPGRALRAAQRGRTSARWRPTSVHRGARRQAYAVTGPELLSGEDLARVFSEAAGKPVKFVSPDNPTTAQVAARQRLAGVAGEGAPRALQPVRRQPGRGRLAHGEKLLGRPLPRLRDYVAINRAAFA